MIFFKNRPPSVSAIMAGARYWERKQQEYCATCNKPIPDMGGDKAWCSDECYEKRND